MPNSCMPAHVKILFVFFCQKFSVRLSFIIRQSSVFLRRLHDRGGIFWPFECQLWAAHCYGHVDLYAMTVKAHRKDGD